MLYYLLSLIPWLGYIIIRTKKALHMLQQNLYNRNQRYQQWLRQNYNKHLKKLDLIPVFIILISLLNNNCLTILSFTIIYLILFIFNFKEQRTEGYKKPLVVTPRIKRLLVTQIVIYSLLFYYLGFSINNIMLNYSFLIILGILTYYLMIILVIINKPGERLVYYYFKIQATTKLKQRPNLKIIGVTGSYGKTSTKNILSTILNVKYNAFASPRNLNTPYGLMDTINNYLGKFEDVFIAEMGAYKVGEIKELCALVKPKYGILTNIGEAHLSTFKTRENIVKTKFELIESLPKTGLAILNGDDERQLNYKLKNECQVIWFGINNKDVAVRASDIKMSERGTTFNVSFKGEQKQYKFETRLLGFANVYNVLAAITLGSKLGLGWEELKRGVQLIEPIKHRLELKRVNDLYIIDDAYNSNPKGAEMAVTVLGMMPGQKIMVTPGMIELGAKQEFYNFELGKQMALVCDIIILIGEKQTAPILAGLKASNYKEEQIYILNDIKEAFPLINKVKTKNTYVLLENDLPDIFSEE